MEQKLISEGKCLFCGGTFAKAGINRHLQKHLVEKVKENDKGKSFLVKVELNPKWGAAPYFLSLWIDGDTALDEVDSFLRAIWLECCGHMSAFIDPKAKNLSNSFSFDFDNDFESYPGEVSMDSKAKKVFEKGLKLEYEYDFGSTTPLLVTVVEEYAIKADEAIVLLSRNEPLEILCHTCKTEPATKICIAHGWQEDNMFCPKCAKKHAKKCEDFSEYAAFPAVNSPRMAVCAYFGGTIDKERDGVFVKP